MNKKASLIGVLLALFLFMNSFLSSAACSSAQTPGIVPDDYFEIPENELFVHDFNLSNMDEEEVFFTAAPLSEGNDGFSDMSISSAGVLRFTPESRDVGLSRVAVIAALDDCADTLVVTFNVLDKPDIASFKPLDSSFLMNQTETVVFSVTVAGADRDENLSYGYEWFLDHELLAGSVNKTFFAFRPSYDLSGMHIVEVRIVNNRGLSTTKTWTVQISRVNRAPVLIREVPGFMVFSDTGSGAYDLDDYFVDPEGGLLSYDYRRVEPGFELKRVVYANVSVGLEEGFVTFNPLTGTGGYAYFVFTATDLLGESADSNIVRVDVISPGSVETYSYSSEKDYCGDYVCGAAEDCYSCPFDCGKCEGSEYAGCRSEWNCTEWSPCMPAGFMVRNCSDLNNCGDNRTKPDEVVACMYTATCDDGLKNGIEEGVDCGGPCDEVCPSCDDSIMNQNETDVDCGGPCQGCPGGMSCLRNRDCASLRCEYLVCTTASCSDGIRNQGEEGVDCGGPCNERCGNCSDNIQNGDEKGIDCGGMCRPCPSCSDGLKNGDETLADCGGSCRSCTSGEYVRAFLVWFIVLVVIIGLIPLFLLGYFFYLLAHPEKARVLFESSVGFTFLVGANRFFRRFRKLRKKTPVLPEAAAREFLSGLSEIEKQEDLSDRALYSEIIRVYKQLIGLPEDFDRNIFNMKLRASKMPVFMKILFAGFFNKADILSMGTFVASEEKQDLFVELKFLLNELGKG